MNMIDPSRQQFHQETITEAVDRMTAARFKVLVADDSAADQILAQRRLSRSSCLELVGTAAHGDEVKDYLTGNGKYADRKKFPFPDLLLLDIDMPYSNGFEVLVWIKSKNFPSLRIVMLSGHADPEAGVRALCLGADYYQTKNTHPSELNHFIRRIEFLMVLLDNREPRKDKLPSMNNMLTVVDGRAPPWRESITAAAADGRNFVLVLESEKDLEKLWSTLGPTTVLPDRLRRWGLLALTEALTNDDFARLQSCSATSYVYLIEQITLSRNIPPRTRRFLLYCEIRGIISHHDTVEQAGLSLLSYLSGFKLARLLPLAGIYDHTSGKWERVKTLTSNP